MADLSLVDRGAALEPENPLVATRIAENLGGGIELGDSGFGVRLVSPSESEAEVVEDRAFFPTALADSDLVVMPTPLGVQLSVQVRSPDAPEQAVLESACSPTAPTALAAVGSPHGWPSVLPTALS